MTSLLSFLQGLGQLLLHSFWLMGLCWLLALLSINVLKNQSARIKQKVLTVLLIIAVSTLGLLGFFLFSNNQTKVLTIFTWQIQNEFLIGDTISKWIQYTSIIFSGLYLLGMVRKVFIFTSQLQTLRSFSNFSSNKVPIHLKLYAEEQRFLLGIRRRISIIIKENISTACTIGFWKPVILLPAAALSQLTTIQLEAIILHELSHIKKLDFIINWALVMLEQLFFFNPFVQKISRLIKEYREQSSDELVLQFKYSPLSYAEALLILAKYEQAGHPLMVSATDGMLKRRIEKMLYARAPKVQFPLMQLCWIASIALVLTVSIKNLPTRVQTDLTQNNGDYTVGFQPVNILPVSYSISKTSNSKKPDSKLPVMVAKPTEDVVLEDVAIENTPIQLSYIANTEPERAYSLANTDYLIEGAPGIGNEKKEPYLPKNSFDFKLSSDNIVLSTEIDAFKENLINEMISEINQLKSIELIERESGSDLTTEKERSSSSFKSKIEDFNKRYPNQLSKALTVDMLSKQLLALKYKTKAMELKNKKENLFAEYKYIIELSSDSTGKKTVVF